MTPPPFPAIETPRLQLREIAQADAPALLAIHGDAEAMKWYGVDPPATLGQADQLVAAFSAMRLQPNPGARWGLVRKSDGRLVGTCGLFKWNRQWRSCTTGYELAREAWGQGLMREALGAALRWGLLHMELERVEALVHPDNAPSLKLLHGLGFVDEGVVRECARWQGRRHDMRQLGLLARDFKTR